MGNISSFLNLFLPDYISVKTLSKTLMKLETHQTNRNICFFSTNLSCGKLMIDRYSQITAYEIKGSSKINQHHFKIHVFSCAATVAKNLTLTFIWFVVDNFHLLSGLLRTITSDHEIYYPNKKHDKNIVLSTLISVLSNNILCIINPGKALSEFFFIFN